jgi:hypothetical protein
MHKSTEGSESKACCTSEEKASVNDSPCTSETFLSKYNARRISFLERLPRELRDTIYDYTFEHTVKHRSDTNDHVTFHFHAPIPNLQMVSRQFTAEYDERYKSLWPDGTVLTIVNDSQYSRRSWKGACPRLATRCTVLKTSRTLFDGCDKHDFESLYALYKKVFTHCNDVSVLVPELPHLRQVDVSFNCEFLHHYHIIAQLLQCRLLCDIFETLPREGTYELCYQGLTYPLPRNLRKLDVPDIDILSPSVTLVAWTGAPHRKYLGHRELEQRLRVEEAVLEAWKAVHRYTLWESQNVLRKAEGSSLRAPPRKRKSSFARFVLGRLARGLLTDDS